jgi:hypothetical protein
MAGETRLREELKKLQAMLGCGYDLKVLWAQALFPVLRAR